MQADGRLIQHIEYAGESRADLARQADALRLTTREGLGGPGKAQVGEAHLQQKAQPSTDLPQDGACDTQALPLQCQMFEKVIQRGDGQGTQGRQRMPLEEHMAGALVEARPTAVLTLAFHHIAAQHGAQQRRLGLLPTPRHLGSQARVGSQRTVFAARQYALVRAMQQQVLDGFWQLGKGCAQREGQAFRQHFHLPCLGRKPFQHPDGAIGQAQVALHQALGLHAGAHAEAIARRARPFWAVEGEHAWLEDRGSVTAGRAGCHGGERGALCSLFHGGDFYRATAQFNGAFQSSGQPISIVGAQPEAVHHHRQ
jgi:hypothetical protein